MQLKKLIDKGVNINQLDEKERVPLQYLINLKYTDEELEPLYQIWFAQNSILVNHKNAWGKHHWKLLSKCRIGQVYWKG